MKNYAIFWAVVLVVTAPVVLGLMIDAVSYNLFALAWAAMWWVIFTRTERGRKAFIRGYRIACCIMRGADV